MLAVFLHLCQLFQQLFLPLQLFLQGLHLLAQLAGILLDVSARRELQGFVLLLGFLESGSEFLQLELVVLPLRVQLFLSLFGPLPEF